MLAKSGTSGLVGSIVLGAGVCFAAWLPIRADEKPAHQRMLSGNLAAQAELLKNRIESLQHAGKFDQAIPLAEQVLALREQHQGADHWETVDARWQLATLRKLAVMPEDKRRAWQSLEKKDADAANLYRRGQFEAAAALFRDSAAIHRDILGEEHPDVGRVYNNLAATLDALQRYAEAEPVHRQALAIRQKALGERHPDVARSHHNLGYNLAGQERAAEALPLFQEAVRLRANALGPEHALTLLSASQLADVLEKQGRLASAEGLHRHVLALREKALGAGHPDVITARHDLVSNLRQQRRWAEAEPLARQVLAAREKIHGAEHRHVLTASANLAAILQGLGKHDEAEALWRRNLATLRRVARNDDRAIATAAHNLAICLLLMGKESEAESLLREALALFQNRMGADHPEAGILQANLAATLYFQGKHQEALAAGQAAARQYEIARLRAASDGVRRAGFAFQRSPWFLLAASHAHSDQPREAWEAFEAFLGRGVLDELASGQTDHLQPEERQRHVEWSRRLDELSREIAPLVVKKDAGPEDRARLDELLRERSQRSSDLAEQAMRAALRQVARLEDVQARLSPDAALVAWLDVKKPLESSQFPGDHLAVVVRKTGTPRWVRLPGGGPRQAWTRDDDDLAAKLRDHLASPRSAIEDATKLARRLHDQRLGPLEPHLAGVRLLIILPIGHVARVPIEVLTDRYQVAYAPSATIFARLATPGSDRVGDRKLLALADPALEEGTGEGSAARGVVQPLAPLPGARREVAAIASLFPAADVFVGRDASEHRLLDLARRDQLRTYRVVHLAAHARVNFADGLRSAVVLSGDSPSADVERRTERALLNDGNVDVSEILAHWRLDAELVTLSACDTGLGEEGGGEGLVGFSQALLGRGARSVLLSLWPVSDAATSLLMVRFYENWLGKRADAPGADPQARGMTKAEALREAKHWLRNLARTDVEALASKPDAARGLVLELPKLERPAPDDRPFAHPYYWSAFILVGDPE